MENFRNINPVKVDKTTIISLKKGKLPTGSRFRRGGIGAMMIDKRGR
jgi:replicative DNA helicase